MTHEALRRLPRFGVVDGVITPHHKGTMIRLDDALRVATPVVPAEGLREALLDEMSDEWVSVERSIWPEGPAHGTGSGDYAALKARIIYLLAASPSPALTRAPTTEPYQSAASPSPDTDRENVMDEERMPCAIQVEGSIGACLIAGTDYRVAEIREHHEPSGVRGVLGHETTVIRFDPVPSPDTDAGLDVDYQALAADASVNPERYHLDPIYHAIVHRIYRGTPVLTRLATPDKDQPV